jgi:site-specific DNA-cytosine methylase
MANVRVLDCCTGVGGMGLLIHHTPVMYVEREPFCRDILQRRMDDGCLPEAPISDNVTNLDTAVIAKLNVTHIFAGFPCQDISSMGIRKGIQPDTRSGLLFDILRTAVELRTPWLFLENVEALLRNESMWCTVVRAVSASGYDMAWTLVAASHLGAPHVRRRWFALCRRRREGQPNVLTPDPGRHRYPSGIMIGGKIQPLDIETPKVPRPPKIGLRAPTENAEWKELGATKKSIQYWATPRTSASSCNKLTLRSAKDLGTQLRYAVTTPTEQAYRLQTGICASSEYVEWMMGFPKDWTDATVSVSQKDFKAFKDFKDFKARHWGREPSIRTVKARNEPNSRKRQRCLGNACVPQTSARAWSILNAVWDTHIQRKKRARATTPQAQVPKVPKTMKKTKQCA